MKKLSKLLLAVAFAASFVSAIADSGRFGNAPHRLAADATVSNGMPGETFTRVKTRPRLNFITSAQPASRALKQASKSAPLKVEGTTMAEIRGIVAYSNAWLWPGLYTVPTSDAEEFNALQIYYDLAAPQMSVEVDGVRYVHDLYSNFFDCIYGYDAETGDFLIYQDVEIPQLCGLDLAKDPTTGKVYAIAYNDTGKGFTLSIFNYSTDEVTYEVIGDCAQFLALACDSKGQLYAIDDEGDLYKLDKETAESTLVGSTGFVSAYISSATIDPVTDRMYWNVCPSDGTGLLVEVDLTTGTGTLVYEFPDSEEIVGLEVYQKFIPAAPAAVTGLETEFAEGRLSGTVSFDIPTTNMDGSEATGTVSYVISADDVELANGSATCGTHVEQAVTVSAAGQYTINVVCSNSNGEGAKATKVTYIGPDTPKAPTGVTADIEGSTVTLNWTAVTEGVHGGWIVAEDVTYTIEFNGEPVAEGVKDTTWSETVENDGELSSNVYTVYACFDRLTSAGTSADPLVFGSLSLPWEKVFDNTANLDEFVIIDANHDGKPWMMSHDKDLYYARVFYNNELAMDDWLICPPIKMEAGKKYELIFHASGRNNYPEIIEVKYGTEPTVETMTTSVVESTTVVDVTTITAFVSPEADGKYYIGFHGMSEPNQYELRLFDISLSAAKEVSVPLGVNALTPEAAEPFSRTINVNVTAPTMTVGDTELTSIDRIELSRDGVAIYTFDSPRPGEKLTYTDTVDEYGDYTYTAVVYANGAASSPISANLYVGPTLPGAVEGLTLSEPEPGNVRIMWEEPTVDDQGRPLPAGVCTYAVVDYDGKEITRVSETAYDVTVNNGSVQTFANFGVAAITEAGDGVITFAEVLPVGKAYIDFAESFTGGSTHYNWAQGYESTGVMWYLGTDNTIADVQSYDHDNGLIYMQAASLNDTAGLASGKISVGKDNPVLIFYTYNIIFASGSLNTNIINVDIREGGGQWQNVYSETVTDLANGEPGWAKIIIDLADYAGKDIQFKLQPVVKVAQLTIFDNFAVTSFKNHDLSPSYIVAPAYAVPGEEFEVEVVVENVGREDTDAYNVELYVGGKQTETKEGALLAASAKASFTFSCTLPAIAEKPVEIYALVKSDSDENSGNDKSTVVAVTPKLSTLPVVTDLSGHLESGIALLEWSEPDLNAYYEALTEDFESGESFAFEYDGWTFVDVDNKTIGGFNNYTLPNIEPGTTRAAFFVFDNSAVTPDESFDFSSHSGNCFLAAMYASNFTATDDWAISPKLSGNAQTVEFFARSFTASYPEKIEVLWSDGSLNPDDFVSLGTVERVPEEWTLYSYELPAGAEYFAIRSCATDSFILMIDDVKYENDEVTTDLEVSGYNVYADSEKVNTAPIADCSYTHASYPGCEYVVTALYKDRGESRASNVLVIAESSIYEVTASSVVITGAEGIITIDGEEGTCITVSTTDGRVVYSTASAAKTEKVSVGTGIYLVKAGDCVAKVLVN